MGRQNHPRCFNNPCIYWISANWIQWFHGILQSQYCISCASPLSTRILEYKCFNIISCSPAPSNDRSFCQRSCGYLMVQGMDSQSTLPFWGRSLTSAREHSTMVRTEDCHYGVWWLSWHSFSWVGVRSIQVPGPKFQGEGISCSMLCPTEFAGFELDKDKAEKYDKHEDLLVTNYIVRGNRSLKTNTCSCIYIYFGHFNAICSFVLVLAGPGGSYSFFAGVDATRAFMTGIVG